jgi:hypothetical protein
MFASDGRLHQVRVVGATSFLEPGTACWPVRHGFVTVKFLRFSPSYTGILRIGYLWSSSISGQMSVSYGTNTQTLAIHPGLHAAYLPVRGATDQVIIQPPAGGRICIGDAQAGNLVPAAIGKVLPPVAS